jgi:crotonobetainyl-CoA:carnitine CoA-transferase CaiB-like acyl-CoA transferase
VLEEWVPEKTRDEMWEIIQEANISCAPVMSLGEVLADPHLQERHAFKKVFDKATGRELELLAPWIHFSDTPADLRWPGPAVGEHNEDVYSELLGLETTRIDALRRQGVI